MYDSRPIAKAIVSLKDNSLQDLPVISNNLRSFCQIHVLGYSFIVDKMQISDSELNQSIYWSVRSNDGNT